MFGECPGDEARSLIRGGALRRVEAAAVAVAATLQRFVVTLSFWTAVCVPVVLGASLFSGIETMTQARTFLGLATLETVALFGGRTYAQG